MEIGRATYGGLRRRIIVVMNDSKLLGFKITPATDATIPQAKENIAAFFQWVMSKAHQPIGLIKKPIKKHPKVSRTLCSVTLRFSICFFADLFAMKSNQLE